VSIHHNVLAHNDFRNPLLISGGTHDVVNNVIYDWGSLVTEIVDDAPMSLDIVGNWYRPGASSKTPYEIIINPPGRNESPAKIFVAGNRTFGESTARADDWSRVQYGWKGKGAPETFRAPARFSTASITTTDAQEAMTLVLANAGAIRPRRDAVDARIAADVRNGTGSIIDSPDQVGGYPAYRSGVALADADGDGMPDAWERSVGLNPMDSADGNTDRNGDGYTNLEEYLHSLMESP
jgi:hypothetical protein